MAGGPNGLGEPAACDVGVIRRYNRGLKCPIPKFQASLCWDFGVWLQTGALAARCKIVRTDFDINFFFVFCKIKTKFLAVPTVLVQVLIIIKLQPRKWEGIVGTGWSWLRIGTGGGLL